MTKSPKGRRLQKSNASPKETLSDDGFPCSAYPHPLRPQHEIFVGYYLQHFNGSRAAREAGFSVKTAYSIANQLLNRIEVRAEILRRRHAASERLGRSGRERYDLELERVAFASMGDMAPLFGEGDPAEKLRNLTPDQAAVVASITVEEFRDGRTSGRQVRRTKFTLAPKAKGLELLGRANGWIVDKIDHKHDHQHQHTILAALLVDISARQEGKPIVDETAQALLPIIDNAGEAA